MVFDNKDKVGAENRKQDSKKEQRQHSLVWKAEAEEAGRGLRSDGRHHFCGRKKMMTKKLCREQERHMKRNFVDETSFLRKKKGGNFLKLKNKCDKKH